MEQDRTLSFRSIWELVKLLVSAVETSAPEEASEPSWFEEKAEKLSDDGMEKEET